MAVLVVRIIVYVECIIISHECDIGFSYLLLYIIRFLLIRQQSVGTVQEQPTLYTLWQVDFIKGNIGGII